MNKIWAVICRDAKNVTRNAISIVICIGLSVMPSFYAWFNIAGSWDPYGNTHNLKVALANADEGYASELLPAKLNLGDSIVSDLSKSTKIGYVVTSEDDAIEGVRSGDYYAAIVFPADFSDSMMSVLSGNAESAHITYYSNEKRNAIASIVTEKASTSVRKTVDQTFTESLVAVGASVLDDLTRYMGDDEVLNLASQLDRALDGTGQTLRATATTVGTYGSLVSSLSGLIDSTDELLGDAAGSLDGTGDLLRQTSAGVSQADSALSGATATLNDTLQASKGSFDDVAAAIDNAYSVANGQTEDVAAALEAARGVVAERRSGVETARDRVAAVNETVKQLGLEGVVLDGLVSQLDATLSSIDRLNAGIATAADDLANAKSDAAATRTELQGLIADAEASVKQVRSSYEQTLQGSLASLAEAINDAAGSVDKISASLDSSLAGLSTTADATRRDLATLNGQLLDTTAALERLADKLDGLKGTLAEAAASGSVEKIRTIIGSDPSALAAFIAAPVQMNRTAIYPVENNGSAMAPYYTAMCLWVGGTLMGCVVAAKLSRRGYEETGASQHHAYFGRLAYFLTIGFFQSTIVVLGELFYLGIQCAHPILYLLCGWCASLVFINIIYALTVAFGDIGKAVAVLFMVVQVAGSGGTFPAQMLPGLFQKLYPFLPFVHAETALRACIAGFYGNDYWLALARLLAFLAPALLLGLVLSKPFERAGEWFERKLESTRLM